MTPTCRTSSTPGYRDLVWSEHGSLVLAGNAALAWAIIFLHELGHLGTARAAGVPARMGLGTRLQFLAVQTDVSGVWSAPRRIRITVYLAGIAVNLVVAAAGVFVLAATGPGPVHQAASVVLLMAVLLIPTQALVFMRTDLYFVLQDLTGCRNLYADGAAHLRHLANRVRGRHGPSPTATQIPSASATGVGRASSGFDQQGHSSGNRGRRHRWLPDPVAPYLVAPAWPPATPSPKHDKKGR